MATAMVSLGLCVQAQDATTTQTAQTAPPARSAAYPGNDAYVNTWGVGAQLGAPIGVNAKYWMTDMLAADAALGWSPFSHTIGELHADILINDFDIFQPSRGKMPAYIGIGLLGRLRNDNRSNLAGFRFPIGVSYMFENRPFDVFAEIAPEAIFAPFGRGGIDGTVGFRYWFQ